MNIQYLTIATLAFLFCGCSYDSTFLYPYKFSPDTESVLLIDHHTGDTMVINFGKDYQPVFTTTDNDTLDAGCSIKSIVFSSASGNILNGWMLSPYSDHNEKTLFFLHGNAGDVTTHFHRALPFVERGFRVFLFDYSGFGFSEGEATRDNALIDASSALEYLLEEREGNPGVLLIYGQSYGGHLAVTVAARYQEEIDGLITEGAFSSHKNMAAEKAGIFGCIFVAEKYSGLESIEEYYKPLLIIHSNEDDIVPFTMGQELYRHANEPKVLYEIDGCHICGPRFYADSIVVKIDEMMERGTSEGSR